MAASLMQPSRLAMDLLPDDMAGFFDRLGRGPLGKAQKKSSKVNEWVVGRWVDTWAGGWVGGWVIVQG